MNSYMHYIIKFILLTTLFLSSLNGKEISKVSLQLQWKHQFQFAGYYIAKEKGFFKDAGFDVDIKEYKLGTNIKKKVLDGESTFAVGRSTLIINKSHGDNIVLLASIFQSSPHILLATKASGIKSVQDFANKKVMFTGDAKEDTTVISMIFSKGLTLKDIQIVKHSFNVDDLISKKADLMSAYISNEPYILKEKGYESTIFDPKDYGFDFYNDILFTSSKYLKNNSEKVRKFTEASLKGWKYAFDNIEETAKLIFKKYNTQNKSLDALIYEGIELKKLAYYHTDKLGNIDKEKILKIFDYYKLMGYTKNEINLDEFILQERKLEINPNLKKILTQKEIDWIQSHPSIKVCNELDYPPFDYVVEGIPQGYSIDLINKLAKYIDIDIEYVNGYTWDELIKMFRRKELDLLHSLTKSPEREKFGIFSLPYIRYKTYIYTTKENNHIQNIDDLFGKTVVVGKGWSVDAFLTKNYPQIKLIRVNNVKEMLLTVSTGKADALINDKYSTLYDIKQYETDNIMQAGWFKEFDNNELRSYHFLAQKNNPELISILNKALTLIPDTQMDDLKEKWFGEEDSKTLITLSNIEKQYLRQKKQLNICIDPAWMPFEAFDNTGKHTGISSDYFQYFKEILPIDFNILKTKSWSQSLQYAQNRTCDILSLAMQTSERKQYMNFTSAYLKVPLVIATKLDVPFIDNLQLVENKTVAIPKGYAFIEILKKKYPNIKIVEVNNIEEGLEKVNKGEIFGYVGTLPSVGYKFQTQFTGELKIAGKFDENWELGVGVRNDDPVLLDIMQKAINSLTKRQQQTILNHWISVKYETGKDYSAIWKTLVIFFIILLVIAFYIRRLNNLKEKITKSHQNLEKFINTQENMVMLTDGENITFANKSFFNFFGYTNLEHFQEEHNCICEKFIENDKFFHLGKIKDNDNWIDKLIELPHTQRVVSILGRDFTIHAFTITINHFNDELYIVSFTNITQTMLSHIELQNKSVRDKLTNAYNREYFDQNIHNIIEEAQNTNYLLGVAFLDIDYFKTVNDTYGHDVGDSVLVHFVNTIHKFSRDADIFIRWGGEEFILLLKVKSQEDLQRALEHLRKGIEIQNFPTVGYKTCSIGGTIHKYGEDIVENTIKRADIGVYEAKENGRNKVVIK